MDRLERLEEIIDYLEIEDYKDILKQIKETIKNG